MKLFNLLLDDYTKLLVLNHRKKNQRLDIYFYGINIKLQINMKNDYKIFLKIFKNNPSNSKRNRIMSLKFNYYC